MSFVCARARALLWWAGCAVRSAVCDTESRRADACDMLEVT
jgi:hypothetical protein